MIELQIDIRRVHDVRRPCRVPIELRLYQQNENFQDESETEKCSRPADEEATRGDTRHIFKEN